LPIVSLEVYGRLTTVFFSLIIIAVIYYLALKEKGRITAVTAASIYAVFPFFVFFSRVVLPETTALAMVMLALFFLYLWTENKSKNLSGIVFFILSLIFLAVGVLIKPTVCFYSLSLIYLFWRKYNLNLIKRLDFYLYFVLAALPFLIWRRYISAFPEGIPPSEWLITSVNTSEGLKNIFFRPPFFRWVFFERINNVIFGGYLTGLFIIGAISRQKKYFLFSLLISAFVYLMTFQGGNVQHEYYQTLILPALAIFVGLGFSTLIQERKTFYNPLFTVMAGFIIMALSFFFSFYTVRDYYNYPQDLIQMAKIMNALTQPDEKIVTDRNGDTTLLYLTDRRGAPATYKSLAELKDLGYNYFETTNKEVITAVKAEKLFPVIFENDQFTLFQL
jgi:4-amino-4-deoxy-L-arabinose transferase-like glycosyltransferase